MPSQIDMCLSSLSLFHRIVSNFLLSFHIKTSAFYIDPPCFPAPQHVSLHGSPTSFSPSLSPQMVTHCPPAFTSPRVMFTVLLCFYFFQKLTVYYWWHFWSRHHGKNSPGKDEKSLFDSHKQWTTERVIWNSLQTKDWEKTQLSVSLNVLLHFLYIPLIFYLGY